MFTDIAGKPVCLICGANVAVIKEFNLRCHYETKHQDKWKCELAFLADITTHLSVLNLQLQGRNRMITDMYDAVKAFQVKLLLWETQMHSATCLTFPVAK